MEEDTDRPLDPDTLRKMAREALLKAQEINRKNPLPAAFKMRQHPKA